jgi:hypothetical protein
VTTALTGPLDLPPLTMITEDLRLYVAPILRDHGISAVGRPAVAGAGVALASAARRMAAAHEVLWGGTGDA